MPSVANCKARRNYNNDPSWGRFLPEPTPETTPGGVVLICPVVKTLALKRNVDLLLFAGIAALINRIEDRVKNQSVLARHRGRLLMEDRVHKRLNLGDVRGLHVRDVDRRHVEHLPV